MGEQLFDAYKDTYHDEVQKAIGFAGTTVDYCTEVKARKLLNVCRRHAGDLRQLEVLDLGCGIGLIDRFLASKLRGLWGVDLSADCIETATRRNRTVHYQAYAGDVLPFPDARFDVVFAICVMHHVPPDAWQPFVNEMRRVVRPGGLTVVFEHNPYNPLTRRAVNRCPFDADAVLLPRRRTAALFTTAGLNVIEGRYILFFPFRSRLLRAIEHGLHWLPLGAQYYVVGRKPGPSTARVVADAA